MTRRRAQFRKPDRGVAVVDLERPGGLCYVRPYTWDLARIRELLVPDSFKEAGHE